MRHEFATAVADALNLSTETIGTEFRKASIHPDLSARLLTPQKLLDVVMRRSLEAHKLRVLVGGRDLHPQDYLRMNVASRGHSTPLADMVRLGRHLASGATMVADGLGIYDPVLEVACRAMQWLWHELVQVNAYLTTTSAAGFDLHWDDHDVVIVQLAGTKSWEVRGPSRKAPMHRDAEPNMEPPNEIVFAGTLHPGDVIHIPRGWWHRATREESGAGYSLHATFGMTRRTGVDYLMAAADESRKQEVFRTDLQRDVNQELTEAATQLLKDYSVTGFLAEREYQQASTRHINTHGLFGAPRKAVCITAFPPVVERDGEYLVVAAANRRITFKQQAGPALDLLLSGAPVDIAQASADTGVDVLALAEVLIEEDICAEATPELLAGYDGWVTP
ncbi:cupin domain-containing protein [Goodfellowiella coeruleoviolacea]|uniref:Cupin superfamily protein n=1 Tax=Goodfellowiella coeruleoviolacea TaxID=334858 RepID=A0AAE3GGC9_9PSEU|nr:cupin domain-containing protein [Goodfellowiella coeruleoviolacea]MCP2166854.1 Cupin superfamily protein [Goodfellowiella coeruleoviolacea]